MNKSLLILLLIAGNCFAIAGDVNNDGKVDTLDLRIFADEWLTEGTLCDFVNDDIVNFRDFAAFAENWTGDTISPPSKAANPDPANGETGVLLNQVLSWTATRASSYDVYFGTANPPVFLITETTESTELNTLGYNTTYYWRIDSKGNNQTVTGDVWNFSTLNNFAPVAVDVSSSTYNYIHTIITLSATDSTLPIGRLKYVITFITDSSDIYVGDYTSGGQTKIRQSDLPYALSTYGDSIVFGSSNAGTYTVKYKAFDGILYSDEKNVTITAIENPQDLLSLEKGGFVTIPDTGNFFDFVDGSAIGCVFQTYQPFCTLMSKLENGTGYVVRLIAGHIVVDIYSNGLIVSTISSYFRYNTGQPVNFVFINNNIMNKLELSINTGDIISNWYNDGESPTNEDAADLPAGDYSNSANLIIGNSYTGEIDAIRCYVGIDLTDIFRSLLSVQQRTIAGDYEMFVAAATVRFKCNYDGTNNTATQIYDDYANHLIGTLSDSSKVKYIPFKWSWYDSAAFQQVGR